MVILQASVTADEMNKPIICPKCNRGKIGNIPAWSNADISRRGRHPPGERLECLQVKCPVCGSLWAARTE